MVLYQRGSAVEKKKRTHIFQSTFGIIVLNLALFKDQVQQNFSLWLNSLQLPTTETM